MNTKYLASIFDKCKKEGHFNKFETAEDFMGYFKDTESFTKLWNFLRSKDYKVPELDAFLEKATGQKVESSGTEPSGGGLFAGVPFSAVETLLVPEESQRKFPDVLKIGNLLFGKIPAPLVIPFYGSKGMMFISSAKEKLASADKAIEYLAFRILFSLPDGKCKIYIIDHEKSGQSFSKLFGLDGRILEKEIWDDESEIANGLQVLKNDIPRIHNELLTTKYKDLKEYNQDITYSRQPFQFILISNFPSGFTSEALKTLKGIISNGSKSGIYCLISSNISKTFESHSGISWDDFRNQTIEYDFDNNKMLNVDGAEILNKQFYIESIDHQITNEKEVESFKQQLNKALDKAQKVNLKEVTQKDFWQANTLHGITIPIGMSEDSKQIDFRLGDGQDVYHALTGGATGKGKTVLLHNIILNGAKKYSPNELEFILMDYKEGTEFKVYETLPHLKVLTISGEVEFGLSVFESLIEEIEHRGMLFKKEGVSDLAAYREKTNAVLPRRLVIMDEFQVLLDPRNRMSGKIISLLEDVSRRGRSFGIHLLLSTQSLADVEISTSTMSNIGLRIALSMPEYDCMKILHVDNDVPVKLKKAGQAVYNAAQGQKAGNTIFQIAFIDKNNIPGEVKVISGHAAKSKDHCAGEPFIFDSSLDVTLAGNKPLNTKIEHKQMIENELFSDMYIGLPYYLSSDHLSFRFRKQQESNLLIIGDDSVATISIINNSIYQIALQSSPAARFYIFDLFPVDSGLKGSFNVLNEKGLQNLKVFGNSRNIKEILDEITAELDLRVDDETRKGRIVLAITNIHTVREFKKGEYDMSPMAEQLGRLLKEGPEFGIHIIVHTISRKSFEGVFNANYYIEFENKIVLKGQNPSDFGTNLDEIVKNEFTGYLIKPDGRYEANKVKIYR